MSIFFCLFDSSLYFHFLYFPAAKNIEMDQDDLVAFPEQLESNELIILRPLLLSMNVTAVEISETAVQKKFNVEHDFMGDKHNEVQQL